MKIFNPRHFLRLLDIGTRILAGNLTLREAEHRPNSHASPPTPVPDM